MVDPAVLAAKTEAVLHHVARLRRRQLSAAELTQDEDARSIVLMDLQQAIQSSIDLALHVCVDDELGAPQTPASAFALLAAAGRISGPLSIALTGAAGLRNLIARQYGDLQMDEIVRVVDNDLDDLLEFVTALGASASGEGP